MENYEKKYKSLVKAVKTLKEANPSDEGIQNWVKDNVPELQKSEDERIRKAIYIYLDWLEGRKDYAPKGEYSIRDMLAWLEKQGEQKHTDKTESKFKAGDIIRRKAPSSYDKDMQVARIEKDYYICNHIGKFSSEVVPFSKESCYELVEQKPADKVKPRFHEGEWITNGDYTWKIVEVKPLDYILQSQEGNIVDYTISHVDEQFHSFTIQDAKDGDVLVYKDEISIYKHDIKNCTKEGTNFGGFVYHCCYDGKRFITDSLYSLTEKDKKDIYPATEEQRDTLFAKMKEAGYEWDVKKKELKKQEIAEIPFGAKDSELQEITYCIPKGFYAEIDGNKVVIKKGNQKPIECICKDVFIEKAVKHIDGLIEFLNEFGHQLKKERIIEDFKKYME